MKGFFRLPDFVNADNKKYYVPIFFINIICFIFYVGYAFIFWHLRFYRISVIDVIFAFVAFVCINFVQKGIKYWNRSLYVLFFTILIKLMISIHYLGLSLGTQYYLIATFLVLTFFYDVGAKLSWYKPFFLTICLVEYIYLNIRYKDAVPTYYMSEVMQDVFFTFNVFISLAIICACLLYFYRNNSLLLNDLEKKNQEIKKAVRAKSDFLANMSHEIRTPMNAIMGMSELMLVEDEMSPKVYEKVRVINSSSETLLTLLNDILDFSKIDSGKMEIINSKYDVASVLNDAVIIVDSKIGEKPIELLVNVNSQMPSMLIGDEIRIKQILINILGNATKFTSDGYVKLNVDFENIGHGDIMVKFEAIDTGVGIKDEDLGLIFNEFEQVDTRRNRNTMGTGLGLAITKRLVGLMGGEITVKSVYGGGTTLTVYIPQTIEKSERIVSIENPEKYKILIYDSRSFTVDSIADSIENMGVSIVRCYDLNTFNDKLKNADEYTHIFYEFKTAFAVVKGCAKNYPKVKFVLLEDRNDFVKVNVLDNETILRKPIFITSIAGVLNSSINKSKKTILKKMSVFQAPDARILVVDDNAVNLSVIEGFLLKYMVNVTTAISGEDAVNLVKENKNYDLIFMDHMMPIMDGVDTTKVIRSIDDDYCKNVPIIALTANAISGVKEMFLNAGMNDFLAKPIESVKLYNIMHKWIPKEKQIKSKPEAKMDNASKELLVEAEKIKYLDIGIGIEYCGGTAKDYINILKSYAKTTSQILNEMIDAYKQGFFKEFVIKVHGIKGSSKSIGAIEISELAALLEKAGNNEDVQFIDDNIFILAGMVNTVIIKIQKAYPDKEEEFRNGSKIVEKDEINDLMAQLKQAIHEIDSLRVDDLLSEIKTIRLDKKSSAILIKVLEYVENFDYDKAEALL